VKIRVLVFILGLASSPALADPMRLAQAFLGGALPPREIVAIVRGAGLVPITAPIRDGSTFALRAIDRYGTPVRVVVDARFGDIVSVRRIVMANPMRPPGVRPPDLLGPLPSDVDDDGERMAPPRVIPGVPPKPPADGSAVESPSKPAAEGSAAVVPSKPPPKRKPVPNAENAAAKADQVPLPSPPPGNMPAADSKNEGEQAPSSPPSKTAGAKDEPKVGAIKGGFPPVAPLQ